MKKLLLFTLASLIIFLIPSVVNAAWLNDSFEAYVPYTTATVCEAGVQCSINFTIESGMEADLSSTALYCTDNSTQLNMWRNRQFSINGSNAFIEFDNDCGTDINEVLLAYNSTSLIIDYWWQFNGTKVFPHFDCDRGIYNPSLYDAGGQTTTLNVTDAGDYCNFYLTNNTRNQILATILDWGAGTEGVVYQRASVAASDGSYIGFINNNQILQSVAASYFPGSIGWVYSYSSGGASQSSSSPPDNGAFYEIRMRRANSTGGNYFFINKTTNSSYIFTTNYLAGAYVPFSVTIDPFSGGTSSKREVWYAYVKNISSTGSEPNFIRGTPVSRPPNYLEVIENNYDNPVYELTNHNFSIVISVNTTVYQNISSNYFWLNGTRYNATNSNNMTSGNNMNQTFNYTNFLIPLSQWVNNTPITATWQYTATYLNWSNETYNQTVNINLYWGLYTNSSLNNTSVIDGSSVRLNSTLNNYTQAMSTVNIFYTWNGTNYSTIFDYYRDFDIPQLDAAQNITYQVWLNVTYGSANMLRNESQQNLTIAVLDLDDCSSYTGRILNLTSRYEDNNTMTSMNGTMQLTYASKQWNFTWGNVESTYVCANPSYFNASIDGDIYYFGTDGGADKSAFLRNVQVDNRTYNRTLRVNITPVTLIEFPVRDELGAEVTDSILIANKWNISDGSYFTVNEAWILSGSSFINLVCPYYYRFSILNNEGSTVYQTDKLYITCTTPADTISQASGTGSIYYTLKDSIAYSLTPNNTNNYTVLTVQSLTGTDISAYLEVDKNGDDLCSTYLNDTVNPTLTCNLGAIQGNIYSISVYVTNSDGDLVQIDSAIVDARVYPSYATQSLLLMVFLVILSMPFLFRRPEVGFPALIVVLWILNAIQFLKTGIEAMIGITVVLGICWLTILRRRYG